MTGGPDPDPIPFFPRVPCLVFLLEGGSRYPCLSPGLHSRRNVKRGTRGENGTRSGPGSRPISRYEETEGLDPRSWVVRRQSTPDGGSDNKVLGWYSRRDG